MFSLVPSGSKPFTWSFLEATANWAVVLGVLIAVAGTLLLGDSRFGPSLLVAGAVDVVSLRAITQTGHRLLEEESFSLGGHMGWALLIRVSLKAILLTAAILLPDFASFAGVVVGVLLVDLTIITAGAGSAVWRLASHSGRQEPDGR